MTPTALGSSCFSSFAVLLRKVCRTEALCACSERSYSRRHVAGLSAGRYQCTMQGVTMQLSRGAAGP